ncbi:MAG TPA: hypothetical protein VG388_07605 [Solirubrobacteraceae bacterium]|nr:hypothetical protein [Solirubrobacteraceae bacterium]
MAVAVLAAGAVILGLILLYALASASPGTDTGPRALVTRSHARRAPLPPRPPKIQARVVISARAPMRRIPASFLGLSTEYWSLPLWARHLSLLDRVLALVHGPGPLIVRIGGDSADRTFWSPVRELPEWAFELTPGWLREVRAVVRHTGARLILDLNLVTATPAIATRWAQVAEARLPKHSIIGFEIGNEPDLYSRSLWEATIPDGRGAPLLPEAITASSYAGTFAEYARTLSRAAPGARLLGPALAEPRLNLDWISRLLAGPHPGLSAITVHRYPYSPCLPRSLPTYPTVGRLLSEAATAGVARSVGAAVRVAHRAGLPLRLTELNSVTCGGVPGISNTFATALWAPDALFELVRAGVSAVSVHVRAEAINAAFSITRRGLSAHPLLYGMVVFRRMLGSRAELVSLRLHARRALHLKAWAVSSGDGVLHVLLIDKGRRSATVQLRVPAQGPAGVERLLAPSVRATGRVTFAGMRLGADGRWRGRPAVAMIPPGAHGYVLTVRRYSAALLSLRLRPGVLTGVPRAL